MNQQFDDQNIWQQCLMQFEKSLSVGLSLIDQGFLPFELEPARIEYAIGSHYMHRGVYCPSLILEQIVAGLHRGRIAKRITKRSKITNIYDYDKEGQLRIAKTVYYTGFIETEYIFYDKCTVYGFVLKEDNSISHISVEDYKDGRIISYFTAGCKCFSDSSKYHINQVHYETYYYNALDTFEVEHHYYMTPGCQGAHYKNSFKNTPQGKRQACIKPGGWQSGSKGTVL